MKLTLHHFKIGDEAWIYNEESGFHQKLIQNDVQLEYDCFFATKAEAIMDKLQESINWSNQLILMLQEEINNEH